jgi:hypothetical protein
MVSEPMDEMAGQWDDEVEAIEDADLETEAEVECPYCGETVSVGVDPGGGPTQQYVEDCPVCCRPWRLRVAYDVDGAVEVWVEETH